MLTGIPGVVAFASVLFGKTTVRESAGFGRFLENFSRRSLMTMIGWLVENGSVKGAAGYPRSVIFRETADRNSAACGYVRHATRTCKRFDERAMPKPRGRAAGCGVTRLLLGWLSLFLSPSADAVRYVRVLWIFTGEIRTSTTVMLRGSFEECFAACAITALGYLKTARTDCGALRSTYRKGSLCLG